MNNRLTTVTVVIILLTSLFALDSKISNNKILVKPEFIGSASGNDAPRTANFKLTSGSSPSDPFYSYPTQKILWAMKKRTV